jgi:hypothetical protein
MLHETLSEALDAAELDAENSKAILAESIRPAFWNGIKYNETLRNSVPITTLKGKPTRKYFHTIISRLDSGRYEVVSYCS